MNLLYNGKPFFGEELRLPITNRAFQYNDGFFETIVVVNGKIRFWHHHLERMIAAAKAMQLVLPEIFHHPVLEDKLLELAIGNKAGVYGRIKLKVWRGGAGLYTPETDETDWLASAEASITPSLTLNKIGVCSSVRTNFSPLSCFKGPNSPVYSLASRERKEKGLDDLIILNRQGLISELTSSNIFWYRQGILYTPFLDTGCINGIMRRNILDWCQKGGVKLKEVYFEIEGILDADVLFSANVTGIKEIAELLGFEFRQNTDIVTFLREELEKN